MCRATGALRVLMMVLSFVKEVAVAVETVMTVAMGRV